MKTTWPLLTAAALGALLFPAAPVQGSDWSNAVDVCQGSLPSFEGALRKRPLGIVNEGTSNAFVSCALRAPLDGELITGIFVLFQNRTGSAQAVSCTLVDGLAQPFPGYTPVYLPKTTGIAANSPAVESWTADDNSQPYVIPNLNCALPPGVEINTLQLNTEPAP